MRPALLALALLAAACGGNVVVDVATLNGTGGATPDAGQGGGAPDGGQLVVCAGVTCMPGQRCCSPAGPELVCFTGTGCPP